MGKTVKIIFIILSVIAILVSLFIWWWRGDFRFLKPEQALRSMEKRYLLPQGSNEICNYKIDSYRCYSGLGALNVNIYIMEKDGIYWHGDVADIWGMKIGIDADVLRQFDGVHIIPAWTEKNFDEGEGKDKHTVRTIFFYMITDKPENIGNLTIYGEKFYDITEHDGYYTARVNYPTNSYESQDEFYENVWSNIEIIN
ncbi:MAG: hypothetical protein IKU13_08055 [Clostridia bacterium]|nr:hypothetical protein [Clostridia bacterium]